MSTFDIAVLCWAGLAVPTLVVTLVKTAPYGRYRRAGWGAPVPSVLAWIVMEAVSLVAVCAAFALGHPFDDPALVVFFVLWAAHYTQRSIIYPLTSRMRGTTMPVSVMLMAVFFNLVNAGTNGWYLFMSGARWGSAWLTDPRFVAGVVLFVAGMIVNLRADHTLRGLRQPGETGYKIPHGGLYRFVSCPNYLGEILEWSGFALATWCLPALAFAVWTVANLAPRAHAHHAWYRARFADYPRERRALIPFIW